MRSQAELYQALAGEVDDELSWSESELPENQRTKHVHRLHPYLGKFVPQLVEVFLRRLFEPGMRVLDPFAGSGTTLVECSTFGAHCHRRRRVGVQRAAGPGEDGRARRGRARARPRRGARPGRGSARRKRGGDALPRALVRAAGAVRAPGLPRAPGRLSAERGRDARPALAGRPLGPADGAPRPRLPEPAPDRPVRLPQAPAHLCSDRSGGEVPPAVLLRHRAPCAGLQRRAAGRRGGRCCTPTPERPRSGARSTG